MARMKQPFFLHCYNFLTEVDTIIIIFSRNYGYTRSKIVSFFWRAPIFKCRSFFEKFFSNVKSKIFFGKAHMCVCVSVFISFYLSRNSKNWKIKINRATYWMPRHTEFDFIASSRYLEYEIIRTNGMKYVMPYRSTIRFSVFQLS